MSTQDIQTSEYRERFESSVARLRGRLAREQAEYVLAPPFSTAEAPRQ